MGNSLFEEASHQEPRVAHTPAKSASVTESTMGFCERGDLSATGSVSGSGNPLTFETTAKSTQKIIGVSILEDSPEATPELDAWCSNFVAASHSASSEITLSVEPKRSLSKKIKELLSPKGIALFKKEMPEAPGFGCENAHGNHVPKNLKRQENQHAIHFQATRKWSKLLKKVKLLKKHTSCYFQGSSVCESEECPVKSRKVRRHSANRALRRFKVAFAFRVGCKPVSVDLVNVHVPDYENDDAVPPEVTTLACEHSTQECDREKSSTKRTWDLEQTSTQAKRRKICHASDDYQTDEGKILVNTGLFDNAPEHEDPEIGLGSPEKDLAEAKVPSVVPAGLNFKDQLENGTGGPEKSLALVIYKPAAPEPAVIDTRLMPFVTEAIIPAAEKRLVPFFETKQVFPVVSERRLTPVFSGKELILVSSEKRLVPFSEKRFSVTSSESRLVPLGKVISLPKKQITISISPERSLVLVSPQKRLVSISTEKQVCSVTSERRLVLVSSGNRLVMTPSERRLVLVSSEKRLVLFSPRKKPSPVFFEKRLILVSSEKRLVLVSSEKRLVVFSPRKKPSPVFFEKRLILVSSEKRLVLYSPKQRLGPASFVKRLSSISVENTILVPQEDSVPTNSVAPDPHEGFVEILSENDFPVRKVREPKLKKWLRKPKSQLWVALELDAILVPELDKNTFRFKYLDLKLKVACKSEIEKDFSEYLVYLRLLLNIDSPKETSRFEDLGYTVIEAEPAPPFVRFSESDLCLESLVESSPCTLSLSQIRDMVQSADDLIDHLQRWFLDQFDFHDNIEDYLLTLMRNLQFTGGTLVKICTDMAGNRWDKADDVLGFDAFLDDPLDVSDQEGEDSDDSDDTLNHYERRLCALMEDLDVLEDMDQSVKKSIDEMISGQKSTMAIILQGYDVALGFKKRCHRRFHKVWNQEEGYIADWELDDEIGCTNTADQEKFIDECIGIKAIDVMQRKVDRTKGLYRIVSAARKSVQRQCEEVSSRFLKHVYKPYEDD